MVKPKPRTGMALALVLGLVLVLLGFGGVVMVLSRAAYREVDVLGSHVNALAVAEATFTQVVVQLAATPWARRSFRDRPDVQLQVTVGQGTADYIIGDTPSAAPQPLRLSVSNSHQADLLVVASYGKSTVTVFWRLFVPENALDNVRRIVPVCYTQIPITPAVSATGLSNASRNVDSLLTQRASNATSSDPLIAQLNGVVSAAHVAGILGLARGVAPMDEVPSLDGGPGRASGAYVPAVNGGPGAAPSQLSSPPPAVAAPPALDPPVTPTASQLAALTPVETVRWLSNIVLKYEGTDKTGLWPASENDASYSFYLAAFDAGGVSRNQMGSSLYYYTAAKADQVKASWQTLPAEVRAFWQSCYPP